MPPAVLTLYILGDFVKLCNYSLMCFSCTTHLDCRYGLKAVKILIINNIPFFDLNK